MCSAISQEPPTDPLGLSLLLFLLLLSFARKMFGVKQDGFGEVDMITAANINELKFEGDSVQESSGKPDLETVQE